MGFFFNHTIDSYDTLIFGLLIRPDKCHLNQNLDVLYSTHEYNAWSSNNVYVIDLTVERTS